MEGLSAAPVPTTPASASPSVPADVLRHLFETAPLMMGVVGLRDGDILHVADNAAAAAFFGTTPDATAGRLASDLGVPVAHLERWLGHYRECAEVDGPVRFRYSHETPGGTRWLEAVVSPAGDAGEHYTYWVEDVTHRVAQESELREREAREGTLLRALPDLLFRLDRDGRYLQVHAPDPDVLSTSAEVMVGRTIYEAIPPDLADRFAGAIRRALDTGRVEKIEYELVTPDDVLRTREARVSPDPELGEVLIIVRDLTDWHADRRALAETAQRLTTLIQNIHAGVIFEDQNRQLLLANELFCDIFEVGAAPEALVGGDAQAALDRALPLFADPEAARARIEATLDAGAPVFAERVVFADGRTFERDYIPVSLGEGNVAHLWLYHDVSERVTATRQLRTREARYRLLAENMQDLVALHAPDGTYEWVSPSVSTLLGYAPEELVGTSPYALFHPGDASAIREGSHRQALKNDDDAHAVYRIRHREGHYVWFETLTKPILGEDGSVVRLQTSSRDVTDRVEMEERLYHQAFHDALTDLPNRSLFAVRLEEVIARYDEGEGFAVLFLDLDRFKVVNDTLGHTAGDRLLQEVGERLCAIVRPGDMVARIGGDEFAVLLDGLPRSGYAENVAARVIEELAGPIDIDGRPLYAGASLGVVVGRPDHHTPDALLGEADLAMYEAKAEGRGGVAIYSEAVHAQVTRRLRLEMDLRQAVERDELRLMFQPIVRLSDGALSGFEALVRWEHPELGLLPPVAFLGPAEESGQLLAVDRWVLVEACRVAATWAEARGPGRPTLQLNVNCSGLDLLTEAFTDDVLAAVARHRFQPGALSLEITEQVLIDDPESVSAALRRLQSGGIGFSLDDFGTGYSSLSTLHNLPVDSVKVDRSFVSDMMDRDQSHKLVETVVHLGRILEKSVVAEGIEDADQLGALQAVGCAFGQGYFFDRPLSAEAAFALATADVLPWHTYWLP